MKSKYFLIGFLAILTTSLLTRCGLIENCPKCFSPPESFRFRLIDKFDSTDLVTKGAYNKDSIKTYYFDNNVRRNIELDMLIDTAKQESLLFSNEMAWKSVEGFKEYFIRLNYLDTDTIYLNVVTKTDDCCTYHPYIDFKYNGKKVEMDVEEYLYKIIK